MTDVDVPNSCPFCDGEVDKRTRTCTDCDRLVTQLDTRNDDDGDG